MQNMTQTQARNGRNASCMPQQSVNSSPQN